jgi:flagellar basal body-associated protein FliL
MAEKAKKKGGKLPIILVAALVVGGGGFFAIGKKEPEKKKEEPEVKLGAVTSLGSEFLINLSDGRTYLLAEISVQTDEKGHANDPAPAAKGDGHGAGGEATFSIARDAVNTVLSGKSIEEITKKDGLKYLKREIAAAINHSLHAAHPAEESEEKPKKKKKKDDHGDDHHAEIDHEWLDELGFDAEEGPILKVYFDKFTYSKR